MIERDQGGEAGNPLGSDSIKRRHHLDDLASPTCREDNGIFSQIPFDHL